MDRTTILPVLMVVAAQMAEFIQLEGIIGAFLTGTAAKRAFHETPWCAARVLGYGRKDMMLMFSLSTPQVAATLAVALVAFAAKNPDGQRLIDEPVLNATIVLVIVTSALGLVLADRVGRSLVAGTLKEQS